MSQRTERELMRLLSGELPPGRERELRLRLTREPELEAAYRRLLDLWRGLEAAPPSPPPPGFAAGVLRRARRLGRPEAPLAWSAAPVWVRAAAAVALAAGLALGVGLSSLPPAAVGSALPAPVGSALPAPVGSALPAPVGSALPAPVPSAQPAPVPSALPAPVDSAIDFELPTMPSLAESYWEEIEGRAAATPDGGTAGESGEDGGS